VNDPGTTSSLHLIGRFLFVAAAALAAIWMLRHFLPGLAWAAVLAIATWPLRERLLRKGMRSTAAAITLTLIVGLVIIVPIIVVAIQVAREADLIIEWVRAFKHTGLGTPDWLYKLPLIGGYLGPWWQDHLGDPGAAKDLLGRIESAGLTRTSGIGRQLVSRAVILGVTLLTLFFVYRDGPRIVEQMSFISDRLFGHGARQLGKEAIATVRASVDGLVLVGLGEGALLGIAYGLAGLRHPVLFGLATGIFAIIPFGAPVVMVAACIALAAQSQVAAALIILLFGSIVIFVGDHFVRPAVIGMSTRVPFLWILLGIFGGLETFGLLGLFIGPAIMSVALAIWREGAAPAKVEEANTSG
jgi:predicted PurR-regulated permease PerM